MVFQWLLETVFGFCVRRSLAKCEGCCVATRNGTHCEVCCEEGFIVTNRWVKN